MHCPCNSSKLYANCCGRYHKNENYPQCPETLMRSRYSAFVLDLSDYLYNTSSKDLQKKLSRKNLSAWATSNSWNKLEVITVNDNKVEFKAYYKDSNGIDQIHHELSTFIKENNLWKYDTGIINPLAATNQIIKRNAPCPCGSGKKYKKCCG